MSKLRELSRELGAEIIYFIPSENEVVLIDDIKGLYLPEYDIIYIRDDLTIIEQENVILHELGHCSCGHTHYNCHSKMFGSKQEAQADRFMEFTDSMNGFLNGILHQNQMKLISVSSWMRMNSIINLSGYANQLLKSILLNIMKLFK